VFAAGAWRGRGGRGRPRTRGRGVPSYGRNDFSHRDRQSGNSDYRQSGNSDYRQSGNSDYNLRGKRNTGPYKTNRPVNALDVNGEPLRCHACGSFRHLLNHCPDKYEAKEAISKVFFSDIHEGEEASSVDKNQYPMTSSTTFRANNGIDRLTGSFENIVMFTGYRNDTLSQLCTEANNSGVVDTACTSTVCGQRWFQSYCDSLDDNDKSKIVVQSSDLVFRFGDGPLEHSKSSVVIPVQIDGADLKVRTDVVECDVPLLFSKTFIKQVFPILDLANDRAKCSLTGRMVSLDESTSGHYTVSISKDVKVNEVYAVNLLSLSKGERRKKLHKLHSQFGHPAKDKLVSLMKNAGCWNDSFGDVLDNIHSKCRICKQFSKTPPRPVVALPLATDFNAVVCMDLKQWGHKWILHMIDMYTRYTVSVFLDRKLSTSVIDAVMINWVGLFGVMDGLLTDNGGEFTSEELREVASILNIDVKTTAAESPWQNGLCERVHQVSDMILLKLKAEYPKSRLHVLLKWANLARNSLQMWNGFSSHQLVFGRNPNLPDIMTAKIPALDEYTSSKLFAEHLNALHAARQAYIKSESAERVRRALRHKIRASQQKFEVGEKVYYKRDGKERWLGPGKVMFQDGKIVFVRLIKVEVGDDSSVGVDAGQHVCEEKKPKDLAVVESDDDDCIPQNEPGSVHQEDNVIDFQEASPEIITVDQVEEDAKKEAEKMLQSSDAWIAEPRKSQRMVNKQLGSSVYLTFVPKEDLNSKEVLSAKEAELEKLKEFNTYEEVDDHGQSPISTRWVVTLKENKPRARLVARGFEEVAQTQNDSPTIGKPAMRLFLTLMSSFHWKIRSTDIKSAFLQGKELQRSVFISPPKEAQAKGKLWKLKRCIYGLNDASRQFFLSVSDEMRKLGCVQCKLEPSLFYKISSDGKLIGVMVCHIDDFLHGGTDLFDSQVMIPLRKRFQTSKVVDTDFSYLGYQINQLDHGIWLDQDHYAMSVEVPSIPVTDAYCACLY
jgi:transposase InsO family protein